jgi:maleate isomerase
VTGGGRIGVVVPSVNTIIETWYPRIAPNGVTVHIARMLLGQVVTPESLREMDEHGVEAASTLATCRPDVIVYGCTASSIVAGREYDLHLMSELETATGCPSFTTTDSVLRAFKELQVKSIAVASPYTEELGNLEVEFLENNGHAVRGHQHLGISNGFELASPTPEQITELARGAWAAAGSADALFIGCMNLGSHAVIESLEKELGVPVVTATQASLWRALRLMGVEQRISGFGRLLASH